MPPWMETSPVRPFGTVEILRTNSTYKQAGPRCLQQIKANPKVEICGMAEGKWIRVEATLVRTQELKLNSIC